MGYITSEMAESAIRKMRTFESELSVLHEKHGLNFRSNLGRRNGIISQSQEVFFADELKATGDIVTVDGRTGEADIVIHNRFRELECKITSGCGGSWALQTDYTTICKKGKLDYLYVLADENFEKFAVLYFDGLTRDDFHTPGPGSREKARMNKIEAMKKCEVLVGSVSCRNEEMIETYSSRFKTSLESFATELDIQDSRLLDVSDRAVKRRESLEGVRERMIDRYMKKLMKIAEKGISWSESPLQFSIELEPV
jgi:hypothetical protein